MSNFGDGTFGSKLSIAAQVTNGVCPTCTERSMFVSITPEIFRCITCGSDLRQYINGSIKYLPAMSKPPQEIKDGESTKVGG